MNIKGLSNIKSLLFKNEGIKQTIFKNTFWLMLTEGVSKGLGFFLTILIARYLEVAGYGKFSFTFAFVAFFIVIADFGLSTLTIRELARDKSLTKKYVDNIVVIKLILGITTFVLIVVIIQFLGKTPEVKTLVYLAGIWVIIHSFTQFFQSIFRAFEKMEYEALSKIVYSVLLFLIAGFILWQNLGIKLLISSYIVAATLTLIFTLILVRKKFTKFWIEIDLGFWKGLLREAWPLAFAAVLMTIYFKIDITMLSIMTTDTEVGLYSAAYNIVLLLGVIPSVFLPAIFPIFAKNYPKAIDNVRKVYRSSIKYLTILSAFIVTVLLPLSSYIIKYLYGNEFAHATAPLKILLFAGAVIIVDRIGIDLLNATEKQKDNVKIMTLCAIVNVLLNLFLIPLYQENGAAIATLLTEIILCASLFYKTRAYFIKPKFIK